MSTNPSVSHFQLNLPRYDGFPYLITRVVSGLRHIIVIPAQQPAEWYQELLHRQGEANQLETCLVLDAGTTWSWTSDDGLCQTRQPPAGGVIVTDRLQPCEAFELTADLLARRARLARFAEGRSPGGFLVGDRTKGGRPATPEERDRLAGSGPNGVPHGLERCRECSEWRGQCLDPSPNFAGMVMQVYCRCENDNRCASCELALAERRLNANYYRESDGHIWHVPGFSGLSHRCPAPTTAAGVSTRTMETRPERVSGSMSSTTDQDVPEPIPVATVRAATRSFNKYVARWRARRHRVRVVAQPYHQGLRHVRAVLEIDGRKRRVYFRESAGGWRSA